MKTIIPQKARCRGWELPTIAKSDKLLDSSYRRKLISSRAPANSWGWTRWSEEVPSNLKDSVKCWVPCWEQQRGHKKGVFESEWLNQGLWVGLVDHSEDWVRQSCSVFLRGCRSIYTKHDPNSGVPQVFYSLSLHGQVYHWSMIYLRSLSHHIFWEEGKSCNLDWSTSSIIRLCGLLLMLYFIFNSLGFAYLW